MKKTNLIFSLSILLIVLVSISCKSSKQTTVKAQVNNNSIQNNNNQNSNLTDSKSLNEDEQINDKLIIKPSEISKKLKQKIDENPQISTAELVEFGNNLIKTYGYDFSFYTCVIAEANKTSEATDYSETFTPFDYELKDVKGKKLSFQIMSKEWGHPCGCNFEIPVLKVGEKEMTVIANGKPYELQRPKDFYLEEVELVDKNLKKTSRKWFNAFDMPPVGISIDGTKIYVETGYDNFNIQNILLEISENGEFKFVSYDNPNIIKDAEQILDFPKDPNNSYLGYLNFKSGNKSYILKYSNPCT